MISLYINVRKKKKQTSRHPIAPPHRIHKITTKLNNIFRSHSVYIVVVEQMREGRSQHVDSALAPEMDTNLKNRLQNNLSQYAVNFTYDNLCCGNSVSRRSLNLSFLSQMFR